MFLAPSPLSYSMIMSITLPGSNCLPLYHSDNLDFSSPLEGFPGGSVVKNSPANARDMGSIPGSERSHGEGDVNPRQYSCLENPMDRGAWQAAVHGVTKG